MKSRKLWYLVALGALCLLAVKIVVAQDQEPPQDTEVQEQAAPPEAAGQDQGPAPGAARISMLNGQVSTQRGDSGEWVAAVVNAPVMAGDAVATAASSRTEIQLDYANALRLDQNSEVKIADLTQKHIQVQIASGLVDYVVFKGAEADVEIDTPNIAVRPLGEGVYRLQIDANSQTELTVRNGRAEVSTPEGSVTMERGQVIYVRGTDNPEYQIATAAPNDEWDGWNSERDRTIEQAQSWQYTNRYYTGSQDLDQYGQWENSPDYGNVWVPNEGPDWVPYYNGNWTWEPYWGWTWVSYEPWGWAPYHYGRWCMWGNRWCWWPGAGYWGYRPLWAPAYVSFLGFGFGRLGFGLGLGFGFGSIGWCPLGPYDRPFGWWGHRNGYNAVSITNITNINTFGRGVRPFGPVNGRYVSNLQAALTNPNIRRGITTMSADRFGRGPVGGFGHSVDLATLRQGQMVRGTLPVVPTRASLMPGNRLASPSAIPSRAVTNTRFYGTSRVAAAPESFNQRAAQIQRMVQQHNLPSGSSYGARTGANTRSGNAQGANGGGIGNANRPAYGNSRAMAPSNQGQSGNSNWQRSPYASPTQGGQPPRNFSNNAPYGGTRAQPGTNYRPFQPGNAAPRQENNQGAWQRFSAPSRPAPSMRGGEWNAPAPRSQANAPSWGRYSNGSQGQRYGGYGNRPTLNLRKPIVVQRPAPRAYGGGGGRSYSAPSGGGGRGSSGGGGGHSGGGGGSHGKR